jgi:hypothetical protein
MCYVVDDFTTTSSSWDKWCCWLMSGKKHGKPETARDFNYRGCNNEVEYRKADAEYRMKVNYAEREFKIKDVMNSKIGEVVTWTKPIDIPGAVIPRSSQSLYSNSWSTLSFRDSTY